YHRYINGFIGLAAVLLVVALFVSELLAQAINACLGVVGAVLLFFAGIHCWRQGVSSARFFVIAWFVFLVAIITFAGNKMGFLPRVFLTEYGMQIGTALELTLLSFALADRINQSRRKQEELLEQSQMYEQIAKAANERALNFEKMSKQRLEKNIKSRTEQLQNALKELTAANRQLEAMSTFDTLTGVRNLNYFNDKLNEEWTRAVRDKNWLSLILVSVDEYELIADRYGYVAAEEILKTLANAITERVARPADLVSRTGTSEFAVLIPNTAPEGAGHVAQAIYDYIATAPLHLGVCSISVSVSISVVSRQPLSGEGWMEYLDRSRSLLIEAIEEGGGRIKTDATPVEPV
ncbi:MAG: diguanylate cyclase, partial [Ketobacteraceae bacterium]|nr:diguanylate cyclase [Ketobacteraceae bacterium]